MIILELIVSFFKIGLFSFGGGYAMIGLLREEATANGWLTAAEFADIVAVSQVTPGPVAVNMATFVGFRQAGVAGAFCATFGVCLPSFILVVIAMKFIAKFNESAAVKGAFYGLRPAVAGLIAAAGVNVLLPEVWVINNVEWRSVAIFALALLAVWKFKVSMILVIGAAAVAGVVLYSVN